MNYQENGEYAKLGESDTGTESFVLAWKTKKVLLGENKSWIKFLPANCLSSKNQAKLQSLKKKEFEKWKENENSSGKR